MAEKKVKVWDLAVRVCHLAMGVLILGAFLTADEDDTIPLHTRLGLALFGVIVFRVLWGFIGPRHARFRDFVARPSEVWRAARAMLRGRPERHLGHNPVGGVMVVALLLTMGVVTATGIVIALGPEWSGPLAGVLGRRDAHAVKELHEAAATALPVLIGLHVLGVIASSLLEGQNLVWGMITGKKAAVPAHGEPVTVEARRPLRRAGAFLAAVTLAGAAVAAAWGLMPVLESEADAAVPVLATYEKAARAEDPGFKGFDAARGKALYFTEHDTSNGRRSCATCHTADARKPGRSPVGKIIEPLAPSANPAAFTDLENTNKWFDRNCKQVLGRTCTARERGDFITYVSSL